VIDGQVDIDGQVVELEQIDGIEIRSHRLAVSGTIDHAGALEIGDTVTLEAVVVGRRYRAMRGDGGPEAVEVTVAAKVVELA
jgi:hypothetical protein